MRVYYNLTWPDITYFPSNNSSKIEQLDAVVEFFRNYLRIKRVNAVPVSFIEQHQRKYEFYSLSAYDPIENGLEGRERGKSRR